MGTEQRTNQKFLARLEKTPSESYKKAFNEQDWGQRWAPESADAWWSTAKCLNDRMWAGFWTATVTGRLSPKIRAYGRSAWRLCRGCLMMTRMSGSCPWVRTSESESQQRWWVIDLCVRLGDQASEPSVEETGVTEAEVSKTVGRKSNTTLSWPLTAFRFRGHLPRPCAPLWTSCAARKSGSSSLSTSGGVFSQPNQKFQLCTHRLTAPKRGASNKSTWKNIKLLQRSEIAVIYLPYITPHGDATR